ncbi:MAG: phosphate transport system protein [Planctomycetota bacterium]|jgi:phosphate transport system protein
MSKHLLHDLEALERGLLSLGGLAEEAVRRAIASLVGRSDSLAVQVIHGDEAIDRAEVALEEECLKALALHQPVASDLRFIAACIKITSDLERIGDLAVNIAERAASLSRENPLAAPPNLEAMTEKVTAMLRNCLDAFVQGDVPAAWSVMAMDDEVDALHSTVMGDMLGLMKCEPEQVDDAMLFLSTSRHLERIADHATNIAEDVVYMVEGTIVRHGRRLPEGTGPG